MTLRSIDSPRVDRQVYYEYPSDVLEIRPPDFAVPKLDDIEALQLRTDGFGVPTKVLQTILRLIAQEGRRWIGVRMDHVFRAAVEDVVQFRVGHPAIDSTERRIERSRIASEVEHSLHQFRRDKVIAGRECVYFLLPKLRRFFSR